MRTKQETFDAVVGHLRRQGHRSWNEKTCDCYYRAPNGDKCAAGVLIPDDKYDPDLEGETAERGGAVAELMQELGHDPDLVLQLQEVHDSWEPEQWEGEFEDIARNHRLTYTPPEPAQ